MNLPKELKSIRLIMIISCLLAVAALSPRPASADESEAGYCLYAGEQYSLGAERGGQVCKKDAAGNYYWANLQVQENAGLRSRWEQFATDKSVRKTKLVSAIRLIGSI